MPLPDSTGASSSAHEPDKRPPSSSRRIIIVKWDVLTADMLGRLAREVYPAAEVTICRTGADALDALRRRPAALGLFGLTLPDIDGLDLLALVADEHLAARRMIVTGRRDEFSRQALRVARVHGVFDTSTEDVASLTNAIKQVGEGGDYFSSSIGSASPIQTDFAARTQSLSFTEQQVFTIMLEGAPDAEIGRRLGMNVETVASHRAGILRRLNVQTIDQLPAFIRRGGRSK